MKQATAQNLQPEIVAIENRRAHRAQQDNYTEMDLIEINYSKLKRAGLRHNI